MNPLKIIEEKMNHLPSSQKVTADYIMKYPADVAFLTVNQLATKVNVSTATVMRLATNLGFSGYSELQESLRSTVFDNNSPEYRLEKNKALMKDANLWDKVVHYNVEKIHNVKQVVTAEKLEEAKSLIQNARNIYCLGVRSGLPITHYLSYGLNRIMGNTRLLSPEEFIDEYHKFDSRDLLIVASFPRYAQSVVATTSIAKQQGGLQVLAFTDSYSAPIAQFADLVIPCDSESLSFHNSPLSSIVVAEYLITALANQDTESVREKFEKTNRVLKGLNYHLD